MVPWWCPSLLSLVPLRRLVLLSVSLSGSSRGRLGVGSSGVGYRLRFLATATSSAQLTGLGGRASGTDLGYRGFCFPLGVGVAVASSVPLR
jgi:hypothetical protein